MILWLKITYSLWNGHAPQSWIPLAYGVDSKLVGAFPTASARQGGLPISAWIVPLEEQPASTQVTLHGWKNRKWWVLVGYEGRSSAWMDPASNQAGWQTSAAWNVSSEAFRSSRRIPIQITGFGEANKAGIFSYFFNIFFIFLLFFIIKIKTFYIGN